MANFPTAPVCERLAVTMCCKCNKRVATFKVITDGVTYLLCQYCKPKDVKVRKTKAAREDLGRVKLRTTIPSNSEGDVIQVDAQIDTAIELEKRRAKENRIIRKQEKERLRKRGLQLAIAEDLVQKEFAKADKRKVNKGLIKPPRNSKNKGKWNKEDRWGRPYAEIFPEIKIENKAKKRKPKFVYIPVFDDKPYPKFKVEAENKEDAKYKLGDIMSNYPQAFSFWVNQGEKLIRESNK